MLRMLFFNCYPVSIRVAGGPDQPSGFGFELTFRLCCGENEYIPPTWPAELFQSLARYVFEVKLVSFSPSLHLCVFLVLFPICAHAHSVFFSFLSLSLSLALSACLFKYVPLFVSFLCSLTYMHTHTHTHSLISSLSLSLCLISSPVCVYIYT